MTTVYTDRVSFEDAMAKGKGCDVWPQAGDYTERTGRALIALHTADDLAACEAVRDALIADARRQAEKMTIAINRIKAYDAEIDRLEIAPNGDDYSQLLMILDGHDVPLPTTDDR